MDRKRQLKNEIAATTEQIQQLDNGIVMLNEKHEKIKLDPFGTRKGKILSEIEKNVAERNVLQEKLDDMNREYSNILKEEQRIKDNKRFFKGDGNKQVIKRIIIGAISAVVILAMSIVGIHLYKNHQINMRKITIGYNSDHIIGMDYETVAAKLREKGFTNVSPKIMEDIDSYDDANRVGVITEASVGGETTFSPIDKFFPETEIIITYHTLTANAIADKEAQIKAEEDARIMAENEKEAALRKEQEEREQKRAEEKAKAEEKKKAKEEAKEKEKQEKKEIEKAEAEKQKEISQEQTMTVVETPINPGTIMEENQVAPPVTAQINPISTPDAPTISENETADAYEWTVYITKSGKRYHQDPNCGGKNAWATTLEDAKKRGLTPCQKCAQ